MTRHTSIFLSFTFLALIGLSFTSSVMTYGLNSGVALVLENEGEPAALAGFLLAVFTASATISRFLTGDLTDHVNHENLLLAGMLVFLAGTVAPIISSSFVVLVFARALQGIGFCILSTVTTVLVAEMVPPGLLNTAMGYRALGAAFGPAVGPTVAIIAVAWGGSIGLHIAISILCGIGVALSIGLRNRKKLENQEAEKSEHANSDNQQQSKSEDSEDGSTGNAQRQSLFYRLFEPKVMPACITEFFRRLVNGACSSFAVLYGLSLGIEEANIFFIAASISIALCRLFGGRWMDSANGYLVMGVLCFSCVIGFCLVVGFPGVVTYAIAGFSYGIFEGLGSPYVIAQTISLSPKEHWGVASSNYFLFGDAGTAVGAWFCGFLIDLFGYMAVPWFAIFSAAITFILSCIAGLNKTRTRPDK